jgi:hypothetical protein
MEHQFALDYYQGFINPKCPTQAEKTALYGVEDERKQRLVLDFLFAFNRANTDGFEDKLHEIGGRFMNSDHDQTVSEVMMELFGVENNLFQLALDIYNKHVDNLCYQDCFKQFAQHFPKDCPLYPLEKEQLHIAMNNLKQYVTNNTVVSCKSNPNSDNYTVAAVFNEADKEFVDVLSNLDEANVENLLLVIGAERINKWWEDMFH